METEQESLEKQKYRALERQALALVRSILLDDNIEELTPEMFAKAEEVMDDARSYALAAGWYRKD